MGARDPPPPYLRPHDALEPGPRGGVGGCRGIQARKVVYIQPLRSKLVVRSRLPRVRARSKAPIPRISRQLGSCPLVLAHGRQVGRLFGYRAPARHVGTWGGGLVGGAQEYLGVYLGVSDVMAPATIQGPSTTLLGGTGSTGGPHFPRAVVANIARANNNNATLIFSPLTIEGPPRPGIWCGHLRIKMAHRV